MNASIHVLRKDIYHSPYLQLRTDTISKRFASKKRKLLLRKDRFSFWSTNPINCNKDRFSFWSTNPMNCDLIWFSCRPKMVAVSSKNVLLLRERNVRRRLFLLSTFLVFLACCLKAPGISFIPQANAEQLCGKHLVDALYYLCGSAGVHTTIIKATTSGVKQPESITVMCCERSCTTEQLEQYCGRPSQSAEERRMQHLVHLAALLSPQNTRRKWFRRHPRKPLSIKPAVSSTTTKEPSPENQDTTNDSQNDSLPFTRVTRYVKYSMQRQHLLERTKRWRQRQADNSNSPEDSADDNISPIITRLLKYKNDDTKIKLRVRERTK